jgi:hypothetical protein
MLNAPSTKPAATSSTTTTDGGSTPQTTTTTTTTTSSNSSSTPPSRSRFAFDPNKVVSPISTDTADTASSLQTTVNEIYDFAGESVVCVDHTYPHDQVVRLSCVNE